MFGQSINTFIPFVQDHRTWGYVLLFLGMVLEGEVFLIVSGMLARLGAFSFGEVLWVALAGVMVGDVFWYGVGVVLSRFDGRVPLTKAAERSVLMFFPNFRTKPFFSILFSKFIYGVNHAALVFSGVLRLDFPLFLRAEFLASFVWVAIYGVAGYMFGHAALAVTNKVTRFALLALAFMVGFILLERWITNYYARQEAKRIKRENCNS